MKAWLILSLIAYTLASLPARADETTSLSMQELLKRAIRLEHGEGVARDVDEAVRLYCRAARAGNSEAGYRLGWMYANGRGVTRNDAVAAAWFDLAAESGDDHARRMLGLLATLPDVENRRCLLSTGDEYHRPLESIPDPDRARIQAWVERLAPEYDLHTDLVLAVIETESGFNPRARSVKDARGLMQLIPATAQRFGVGNIWDPLENLRGGMAYLRWLLDYFNDDLQLALAGYNAGERAVERYRGVPPYAETRNYVKRVLQLYRKTRA